MAKTLPLLALLFSIFAETSSSLVAPPDADYTVGLTGIYPIVFYRVGDQPVTLPSTSSTGHFDVTKIDTTHLQASVIITTADKSTVLTTYVFALERDSVHAELYHIKLNRQPAGLITASNIFLRLTSPDHVVTVIRSKRY